MKKSITAIVTATALVFSGGLYAQAPVIGSVSETVQPALGRQALPIGSVIKGGTDMGKTITGAMVMLPGQQVLVDVVITQVARDATGRVVGGTVSDKLEFLALSAPAKATAAAQATAPASAPVANNTATSPSTAGTAATPTSTAPTTIATGAGMFGSVSPGLLAALAIGAAVVIGGGSSTPSHATK